MRDIKGVHPFLHSWPRLSHLHRAREECKQFPHQFWGDAQCNGLGSRIGTVVEKDARQATSPASRCRHVLSLGGPTRQRHRRIPHPNIIWHGYAHTCLGQLDPHHAQEGHMQVPSSSTSTRYAKELVCPFPALSYLRRGREGFAQLLSYVTCPRANATCDVVDPKFVLSCCTHAALDEDPYDFYIAPGRSPVHWGQPFLLLVVLGRCTGATFEKHDCEFLGRRQIRWS